MKRSVGELRAELLKACRGAGVALGAAEDLASAAAWLDAAALDELAGMLERADGADLLAAICADLDERCAGIAGQETTVRAGPLWQALVASREDRPARGARDVPEAAWGRLSALAARTYVPDTAESRARGAGAGDIDND